MVAARVDVQITEHAELDETPVQRDARPEVDRVIDALAEWERTLRPAIEVFQDNGIKQRAFFVPATAFELGAPQIDGTGDADSGGLVPAAAAARQRQEG